MSESERSSFSWTEAPGARGDRAASRCGMDPAPATRVTDRLEAFRGDVRDRFGPAVSGRVLRALDWALAHGPDREHELVRLGSLLLAQHADHVSVAAMLLSRAVPELTLSALQDEFGGEVVGLVNDLRSASPFPVGAADAPTSDLRPLMESMTRDVRSVLLRVTRRVLELESVAESGCEGGEARQLAREALDVHVPLADRLGFCQLRRRLEDAAFCVLEPEAYRELSVAVAPIREQDEACVRILVDGVMRLLSRSGVAAEVTGRTKGLHSLYRKMLRTQRSVDQIMDRVGVRVVVDSVSICYQVLGLLHAHSCPIPGTFDDYIKRPKENGYQSLHTCVHPLPEMSFKPVEFQIRTAAMHTYAEFGAAAHWRYKSLRDADVILASHLRWLGDLSARCQVLDSPEFVEELRRRVYEEQIVVFQETGSQLRLPAGSTVRDFLRRTLGRNHPEVAVRVNGAHADEDVVLRDGDAVHAAPADRVQSS